MEPISNCLNEGGELYLSGFYSKDIPVIREECEKHGLEYNDYIERDEWVALRFLKKKGLVEILIFKPCWLLKMNDYEHERGSS